MRVLLATYGSRGDVEPVVALAVRLRELGAEVRVCAPPDEEFTELLARVGVPLAPFGKTWRSWAEGPSTAEERVVSVDDFVAEYIAATYETVAVAAEGCDVLVASGMLHFVARSVAEKVAIPHRFAVFSPTLLEAQSWNALVVGPINAHRATIDLPPVDDVREFLFTVHPWVAADPTLSPRQEAGGLAAVRTAAWILPDERPLPAELVAFLDAGTPPVYVGYGSMRVPKDSAQVAIEAIRAQGRRALVAHGWAALGLIDDRDDCFVVGEVNQQALFSRGASGGGAPGGGSAVLGGPGGRPGHRRGTRRSDSDHRVPVGRAQDGPGPRDPRPSDRPGRHGAHRRCDGRRDAAARRGRLRRAGGVHEIAISPPWRS